MGRKILLFLFICLQGIPVWNSPAAPVSYLAPVSSFTAPPLVLDEEDQKIAENVLNNIIEFHREEAFPPTVKKFREALDLCRIYAEYNAEEHNEMFDLFSRQVQNLDSKYGAAGKEYIRIFPTLLEDKDHHKKFAVGVNILNNQATLVHLILYPKPNNKPQILTRHLYDFDSVYLAFLDNAFFEEEWLKKIAAAPGFDFKKELPVPLGLVPLTQEKIETFLQRPPLSAKRLSELIGEERGPLSEEKIWSLPNAEFFGLIQDNEKLKKELFDRGIPQNVERLLLTLSLETTFDQFLEIYPEAQPVLDKLYPNHKPGERIVPEYQGDKPHYIGIVINLVLQEIFRKRFLLPTVGVLDNHKLFPADRPGANGKTGPDHANEILQEFLESIGKKGEGDQLIPFRAFAKWLKNKARRKLSEFISSDSAAVKNEKAQLNHGVLIFDIDKTLLNEGDDCRGENKPVIFYTLLELIRNGVPIRFVSGGDAQKQYERLLKPLEAALAETGETVSLQNVELFASTGSVRIFYAYDPEKSRGQFVKDADYLKTLRHDETNGAIRNLPTLVKQLGAQLQEDFSQLLKTPLGENAPLDPEKRQQLEHPFQEYQLEFLGETPRGPHPPYFMEYRDGASITLSGNGFLSALAEKDHSQKPVYVTDNGKLFLKENFPLIWEKHWKNSAEIKIPLRTVFLDMIDHWRAQGNSRQRGLYNRFIFSKAGKRSIDITFEGVNKATAVRYIFDQTQPNGRNFLPDVSVYFGDEFSVHHGIHGNDLSISTEDDERLKKLVKVHVGKEILPHSAIRHVTRANTAGQDLAVDEETKNLPSFDYVFDSLDGAAEIKNLVPGRKRTNRSYTVALFYQHYPIVAGTRYLFSGGTPYEILISSLLTPAYLPRQPAQRHVYLPFSGEDKIERRFVEKLGEWLESQGHRDESELDTNPAAAPEIFDPAFAQEKGYDSLLSRGSFKIRRLVRQDDPLWLVRQGHAPTSKLGILAHVALRNGKTLVVTHSGQGTQIRSLFPLDPALMFNGKDRYGTIYSFIETEGNKALVEKLIGQLHRSVGEKEPVQFEQENTAVEIAL